jgi:acyl-CoA reductase-like NAD-dependent aldehyde dehydrogenase
MSPATPARATETSRYLLDRSLATLRSASETWASRSIEDRIDDLAEIGRRTMEAAPDLVAEAVRAKGIGRESAGEEWVAGPLAVLRTIRFLRETLIGIKRRGVVPLPDSAIRERPDGQVVVDVMPADGWDRVLYRGWTASVRMDPSVGYARARSAMGGFYTKSGSAAPAVGLVLGAGNVSSIAPLDVVHQLIFEGRVALLKFNPINDYIGPYIEHAFGDLIARGFVRTSYGGVDVGDYLVTHPEVDAIHITGSERSHDAIVFGTGADGKRRKERNEPRIKKPITSELGNVSPVIVVPGEWSSRALEYQARHVATQLLQNTGYNCNAAKVLVVPARWPQRQEFIDRVGGKLGISPDRSAYYPGSLERYQRIIDAGGDVRTFGASQDGLPPTIIGIDPAAEHPVFTEEAFCRIMAVVELDADGPQRFLEEAVAFCNDRLRGTLNATILIDRDTLKENRLAVDDAVDRLRYGSVGVNVWAAACFPLGVTPWGAFPGHTLDDICSGIGFVHNARMIDRPHKTVVAAPFIQVPEPTWSIFHRRAAGALERATAFEADPAMWRLPGLVVRGMRP